MFDWCFRLFSGVSGGGLANIRPLIGLLWGECCFFLCVLGRESSGKEVFLKGFLTIFGGFWWFSVVFLVVFLAICFSFGFSSNEPLVGLLLLGRS